MALFAARATACQEVSLVSFRTASRGLVRITTSLAHASSRVSGIRRVSSSFARARKTMVYSKSLDSCSSGPRFVTLSVLHPQ